MCVQLLGDWFLPYERTVKAVARNHSIIHAYRYSLTCKTGDECWSAMQARWEGWRCDTGAGRRSGHIPRRTKVKPHRSDSAVESPRLYLDAGRAKTAILSRRLPGNGAPGATTSRREIANNRWRSLNDSFHLLKRHTSPFYTGYIKRRLF